MVLMVVKQGGWSAKTATKDSQGNANVISKRDHTVVVHLDKMVLMVVKRGSWTARAAAKDIKGKADKQL
jgi:hypothetical protein